MESLWKTPLKSYNLIIDNNIFICMKIPNQPIEFLLFNFLLSQRTNARVILTL